MKCKWLSDDFTAVCTNVDCDCVADFCPCVNYPEICRYAEDSVGTTYSVTADAETPSPEGEGFGGDGGG